MLAMAVHIAERATALEELNIKGHQKESQKCRYGSHFI